MPQAFNLTAKLNVQGPFGVKPVVDKLRKQLSNVKINVRVDVDPNASKRLQQLNKDLAAVQTRLQTISKLAASTRSSLSGLSTSLNAVNKSANQTAKSQANTNAVIASTGKGAAQAASEMEEFGRVSGLAIRRFAGFSIATGVIFGFINAIRDATSEAIKFEREVVKISQVTGISVNGLRGLKQEITDLSTSLGVSSSDLLTASRTLSQAGFTATQTRKALAALAKTDLAPTFDNIANTTEGAIAAVRQFNLEVSDLEKVLGSINAVAGQFAVESGDIIAAIRRTGGVFAAAAGDNRDAKQSLNEFVALFTSVRATTRESAESIAVGLRTIFARIQRRTTIESLKELGIELETVEGKFVGPFEAVKRLSEGLSALDPQDLRFSQIVEELGGFRQLGKVIPLIQQFETAQKALKVAQQGQDSLARDAVTAQQALAVQFTKTREKFLELIRDISESDTFRVLAKGALFFADSLINVADAFKPVIPLLTAFAAFKGAQVITQFTRGFRRGVSAGGPGTSGISTKQNTAVQQQNTAAVNQNTQSQNQQTLTSRSTAQAQTAIIAALSANTQAIGLLNTNVGSLIAAIRSSSIAGLGGGRRKTFASGGKVGRVKRFASGGPVRRFNTGGIASESSVGAAILRPIGRTQVDKAKVGAKNYNIVKQSLPTDTAKEVRKAQVDGVTRAIVNGASAIVPGTSIPSKFSFGRIVKSAGVQDSIGQIFEATLTLIENEGTFDRVENRNRPFDFTTGFGALGKVYDQLSGIKYIDAKASFNAAKDIPNKIKNQLALEQGKVVSGVSTKREINSILARLFRENDGNIGATRRAATKLGISTSAQQSFAKNLGKQSGGSIGSTIPALTEPGELIFGPNAVTQAGENALRVFNQTGDPSVLRGFDPRDVTQVPGVGRGDSFRTDIPEGSFVVRRDSAQNIDGRFGPTKRFARGGSVRRFANGGGVGGTAGLGALNVATIRQAQENLRKLGLAGNQLKIALQTMVTEIKKGTSAQEAQNKALRAGKRAGRRNRLNQIGTGFSNNAGALGFAALSLAPFLQQIIGQSTPGRAGAGAGVSGAITGGFAGASVGTALGGPIGAVIGGLLGSTGGAISAFQNAAEDAAARIAQEEISKGLDQVNEALKKFAEESISSSELMQTVSKNIARINEEIDRQRKGSNATIGESTRIGRGFFPRIGKEITEFAENVLLSPLAFIPGVSKDIAQERDADRVNAIQSAGQRIAQERLTIGKDQSAPFVESVSNKFFDSIRKGKDFQTAISNVGGEGFIRATGRVRGVEELKALEEAHAELELLGSSEKELADSRERIRQAELAIGNRVLKEERDRIRAEEEMANKISLARAQLNLTVLAMTTLAEALKSVSNSGQVFNAQLTNIASGFKDIPEFKFDDLGPLGLANNRAVGSRLNTIGNFGGLGSNPLFRQFTDIFSEVKRVRSQGLGLLTEAARRAGPEGESEEALVGKLFQDAGFSPLISKAIEASLTDLAVNRQDQGQTALRQLLQEDPQALLEKIIGNLEKGTSEAFNELTNIVEKATSDFAKNSNLYIQKQLEAANQQDNIIRLSIERQNRVQELLGRDIGIAQAGRASRSVILSRTQAAGIGPTLDPRVISRSIEAIQSTQQRLIAARQQDPTNLNLTNAIRDNSIRLENLQKALEEGASNTEQLAAVEKKILDVRSQRDNRRGFAENIFRATFDPKAAFDLQKQLSGIASILSGGPLNQDAVDGLSGLRDIKGLLPAADQESIEKIIERAVATRISAAGGGGLAKTLGGIGSQKEERTLINQFIAISNRQLQFLSEQRRLVVSESNVLLNKINEIFNFQRVKLQEVFNQVTRLLSGLSGVPGKQHGGFIRGTNKGRDSELIMAQPGEFVVSRNNALKNRDLLEQINRGKAVRRFKHGGSIRPELDMIFGGKEYTFQELQEIIEARATQGSKRGELDLLFSGDTGSDFKRLTKANAVRNDKSLALTALNFVGAAGQAFGKDPIGNILGTARSVQGLAGRLPKIPTGKPFGSDIKKTQGHVPGLSPTEFGERARAARTNTNRSSNLSPSPDLSVKREEFVRAREAELNRRRENLQTQNMSGIQSIDPNQLSPAQRNRFNRRQEELAKRNIRREQRAGDFRSDLDVNRAATSRINGAGGLFNEFGPPAGIRSDGGAQFNVGPAPVTKPRDLTNNSKTGEADRQGLKDIMKEVGNLSKVASALSLAAKELQKVQIPEKIQIESAPIQVNVVINGAEAFANMKGSIAALVNDKIQRALMNTINPITGETSEQFLGQTGSLSDGGFG